MSDARDEAYPTWWPSALKKPVADLAALWLNGDFPTFVEEDYVDPCARCHKHIGVPKFRRLCSDCYSAGCDREMRRFMPQDPDPRDLDPLWQQVINRPDWEHILRTKEHREYVSRDASFWGLRPVEQFQAYRVQIWLLAAADAHPAYPWRLDMRDITSDHERLRFRTDMGELYENGESSTRAQPAIARVRLWQIGRRAWIEGVWDRVRRSVRWSIQNKQSLDEREALIWEATKRALSRQGAFRGGRPNNTPAMTREQFADALAAHVAAYPHTKKVDAAAALGISDDTLNRYITKRWPGIPIPDHWRRD